MPEPILALSSFEAAQLASAHRDMHVSFDLFSTELQRLEATNIAIPAWAHVRQYPEDENCDGDHADPEELPLAQQQRRQQRYLQQQGQRGPRNALQHQVRSYRSYMAKRTAEERFWESVAERDPTHPSSDSDDTVCAEKDYSLESGQDKGVSGPLERLRRACQVFKLGATERMDTIDNA